MKLREIHTDDRGTISLLENDLVNYPEVTIFKTNKGYARGGCIHNISDEYCTVIEGHVEYWIGDDMLDMSDGDSMKIPKGTPHYFVSVTDSIVLEWGATVEEKQNKHVEFRKIVDKINQKR